MRKLIIITFIFLANAASAQKQSDTFTYQIAKAEGDLNKDGIPDLAIVKQDTLSDTSPYRLQVFFARPGGKHKLIVSTTKAITAEFPNGKAGSRTQEEFYEITIKNNVITIKSYLIKGNFSHKFRYQKGNFELIGFTQTYSDGNGKSTDTDFNLLTGIRSVKVGRYDRDEIISNKKEKKLIRPLPKLQNFVPFTGEY